MESIAKLAQQYFLLKMEIGNYQLCIDWALDRLRLNQEGDDLNIVLLAAATTSDEATPLIEAILDAHFGLTNIDANFAAGKYVVLLHSAYLSGQETIESLDIKFTKLYYKLKYPCWLTMLSRNCEYATDIPAFMEPFEMEFEYIAGLWATVISLIDFDLKYDSAISNSHDVKHN